MVCKEPRCKRHVIPPVVLDVTPPCNVVQMGKVQLEDSLAAHKPKAPRLLVQVREAIRRRNYSYRTEEAYVQWIRRFIYFFWARRCLDDRDLHPRVE